MFFVTSLCSRHVVSKRHSVVAIGLLSQNYPPNRGSRFVLPQYYPNFRVVALLIQVFILTLSMLNQRVEKVSILIVVYHNLNY